MWMSANYLNLNKNKNKIILFGPPNGRLMHRPQLHHITSSVNSCVKNLGVLLDSDLKFKKQVNSVFISCFFHPHLLTKVKPFLSPQTFERVSHTFL